MLPTLKIARRFSASAYPGLAAKGFEKLILPCEFDAGVYQEIALVAPKPTEKSNARLFFESVWEDVRHILRRARDKILRRTKKKKKRRRKTSDAEHSVSPLQSIPPIAAGRVDIRRSGWSFGFRALRIAISCPRGRSERLRAGDKIVVFTHGLVSGGAERQWVYLAKGLAELGYDVTFVISGKLEGHNRHYLDSS